MEQQKWYNLCAWMYGELPIALRRKGIEFNKLSKDDINTLLILMRDGKLLRKFVPDIIKCITVDNMMVSDAISQVTINETKS